MNHIRVNGEVLQVPAGWRIADLLIDLGHAGARIAVEVNGVIVPHSAHEATAIADQDRIEIVVAVGGG